MPKPTKKCVFKTNKNNSHLHSVAFNDLTDGEIIALLNALRLARTISAVAQDLSTYLRNALTEAEEASFLQYLESDIDAKIVPKGT